MPWKWFSSTRRQHIIAYLYHIVTQSIHFLPASCHSVTFAVVTEDGFENVRLLALRALQNMSMKERDVEAPTFAKEQPIKICWAAINQKYSIHTRWHYITIPLFLSYPSLTHTSSWPVLVLQKRQVSRLNLDKKIVETTTTLIHHQLSELK